MATHSSVLAWRIPGMGSLVGCRLWGHTELDTIKAMQQQQPHELELFESHPSPGSGSIPTSLQPASTILAPNALFSLHSYITYLILVYK